MLRPIGAPSGKLVDATDEPSPEPTADNVIHRRGTQSSSPSPVKPEFCGTLSDDDTESASTPREKRAELETTPFQPEYSISVNSLPSRFPTSSPGSKLWQGLDASASAFHGRDGVDASFVLLRRIFRMRIITGKWDGRFVRPNSCCVPAECPLFALSELAPSSTLAVHAVWCLPSSPTELLRMWMFLLKLVGTLIHCSASLCTSCC